MIAPTRELCQQVHRYVESYSLPLNVSAEIFFCRSIQSLSEQLRCVSLYGGVPYPPQVGRKGMRVKEREREREREMGSSGVEMWGFPTC